MGIRLSNRGQGALEYLLLITGAILVAVIVFQLIFQSSDSSSGLLEDAIQSYTESTQNAAFGGGGYTPEGGGGDDTPGSGNDPICLDGVKEGTEACDGDTLPCVTGGYPGEQACNSTCTGYDACQTDYSCGDDICNGPENPSSCSEDCPLALSCGDFTCDEWEDVFSCANDCSLSLSPKELWMHPNHYSNHADGTTIMDTPQQWDTTLNNLDVFGVFGATVGSGFSLPLLQQKNVKVNVEVGGLRSFECDGTNFFTNIDSPIFDNLVAGGHPDFVASLDSPFGYTVENGFWDQCEIAYQNFGAGTGPDPETLGCTPQAPACNYTIDQVSDELVKYLSLFHQKYPQAQIGWIEAQPLLNFDGMGSAPPVIGGIPYPDFKLIADSLTGKIAQYNATHPSNQISLRFFHSDSYATGMVALMIYYDTWGKHKAMANYVKSKGMRFGILMNDYDGLPTTAPQSEKDKFFTENTLLYYDCWLAKGGPLDDIVVESWVGTYPDSTTPEEQPYTFTNVMYELITRLNDPSYVPTCPI